MGEPDSNEQYVPDFYFIIIAIGLIAIGVITATAMLVTAVHLFIRRGRGR